MTTPVSLPPLQPPTSFDEMLRQKESGTWFDEWKKTNIITPRDNLLQPSLEDKIATLAKVKHFNEAVMKPIAKDALGDLAQEELKRRNEEINKRIMEELESLKKQPKFTVNDVAEPPPGVMQSWGPQMQSWGPQQGTVVTEHGIVVIDPVDKRFQHIDPKPPDVFIDDVIKPSETTSVTEHGIVVIDPVDKRFQHIDPKPQEDLEKALKRLEEVKKRQGELFERLDQSKSRPSIESGLIERPEPLKSIWMQRHGVPGPIEVEISPWQLAWLWKPIPIPQPIRVVRSPSLSPPAELLPLPAPRLSGSEGRRKIPA